jgi:hypothetical protein
MKKLIVATLLLALASAGIWKFRQPELQKLGADAASERARLQSLQAQDSPDKTVASADPDELKRLRALPAELARLRGTVSSLRQRTNQSPEQLEARAAGTLAEAGLIRARREAKEESKKKAGALMSCVMFVTAVAGKTDGTVPATWAEMRARLAQFKEGDPMLDHFKAAFEEGSEGAAVLSDFEIVPVPPDTRLQPRKVPPAFPLLRERQARPQPDGGAARYYAWLSRGTEEVVLKDGNFAAWEAEHFRPGVARAE